MKQVPYRDATITRDLCTKCNDHDDLMPRICVILSRCEFSVFWTR